MAKQVTVSVCPERREELTRMLEPIAFIVNAEVESKEFGKEEENPRAV